MLNPKLNVVKRRGFAGAVLLLLPSISAVAQTPAPKKAEAAGNAEQRAARAYEAARPSPLDLHAFLVRMPKGSDLHYHMAGGIYAESMIRAGAEDGLCVDLANLSFAKPMGEVKSVPPQPVCGNGKVPASKAFTDQHLYDSLIDAFSMRSFVPSAGVSGHDHFFDAFDKFGGISDRHNGEFLDETVTRAASQNEQYMEIMETPGFDHTILIAKQIGWREDMNELRTELLAHGLRDDIPVARSMIEAQEASRAALEHCGQAQATPACRVTVRYIYQVLRGYPKEQVFAQTLLGFEVASADPLFVGINLVMPEDGTITMADYALQMKMVGFLHGLYPKVHITLHAGEIAPVFVPPDGLCCHIRLAVEDAHAERIGHGVDVMYENLPYDLLKEMAAKHIMVEINLTSNDVILGVVGKDHPLPDYRKFHVPVSLSTDDEGVSRSDMTHEFVRAAETYSLSYADLKQMVRTGLAHIFLQGPSLWHEPDVFTRTVTACASDRPEVPKPSDACAAFLKSSEKAQQQWELERRFHAFEATF